MSRALAISISTFFGYEGPMKELGEALDSAKGEITLQVIRAKKKQNISLKLPTKYGSFAKTFPYDCPKTDLILTECYDFLLKTQRPNGLWNGRPDTDTFAALALLGSGNKAFLSAIDKTMRAFAKATHDIGYVWYKDGGRRNGGYADMADMGRTGITALAHRVSPVGGKEYRDFALLTANCIGNYPKTFPDTHGSPLLGLAWTGLGALADPVQFRKLMDYNRWHFAMAHTPKGNFYYQPNRDNNPQDYTAGPRMNATAANALVLTARFKKLQITGAKPVQIK